ncbi:PIN domain-containing protein [Duganella sp. CY15W]|uniref:type II toxin-antitoxin system VapC family toxin n=1 Tax=Duganella sp. CY15W TaxID=2692172 RepID=UPI00136E3D4B|nr:type II toxin-antitoxin system VapC family toxin [Duganella sp. CY15W]MYM30464.1 PIN domain-containing protein [Duganella sp. CY15W]
MDHPYPLILMLRNSSKMIGLDTNVLARYYIDDSTDIEAQRQRPAAQRLIDSGQSLAVCKTVIVELEWLMRGRYNMSPAMIIAVYQHMLSLTHLAIEDRLALTQALANYQLGIAFTDALHHASYRTYDSMVTFDDRKFARRIAALGLHPPVIVLR